MNGGNVSVYHSGDFGPGQPPLDDRTMFQIGSLTKTFTATLLASMVLDGRVKLDQAVQSVAPQGVRIPSYGGQAITFANLAEHNSGLPRLPTNLPGDLNDPYAAYTPALFAQFLSTYTLPQRARSEVRVLQRGRRFARRRASMERRQILRRVVAKQRSQSARA